MKGFVRTVSGLCLCASVVLQTSFYFLRTETFNLSDGAGVTHPNPPQTIHFLVALVLRSSTRFCTKCSSRAASQM